MNRAFQVIRSMPWFKLTGVSFLGLLLMGTNLKGGELVLQEAIAYRAEGRRYQKVGDLHSAAAAYEKAVVTNPSYSDAYNDLGIVLESLGDLRGAERAYKTALQVNPKLAGVHSNLALLYEKMGKLDEAAAHWTARVKSGHPSDPWVGKAREKLQFYRFPVPEFPEEAARNRKAELGAALQRGKAHLKQRRWKEAAAEFERALALDPKSSGAAAGIRSAQAGWKAQEQRRARQTKKVSAPPELTDAKALAQQLAKEKAKAAKAKAQEAQEQQRQKKLSAEQKAKEAKRQAAEFGWQRERAEAARKKELAAKKSQKPVTVQDEADRIAKELAKELAKEKAKVAAPPPAPAPSPESALLSEKLTKEKKESRRRSVQELVQRGLSAMRQGRYAEAVVHYKQALVLDPASAEADQGLKRAQAALAKSSKEI